MDDKYAMQLKYIGRWLNIFMWLIIAEELVH